MPRNDSGLLVVPGGIPRQLEDLSSEILHYGRQVDRGSGTDSLGVVALSEKSTEIWKVGRSGSHDLSMRLRFYLWIRPTGNWRPARLDLDFALILDFPPLPLPDIVV